MADFSEALGKRKRETEQAVSKKRAMKRKQKPKSSLAGDLNLDASAGVNEAIGHMDSSLLADYVAQSIRRFEPDLTSIELEDRYISERAVRDTSDWSFPRTSDTLPQYLEHFTDGPDAVTRLSNAPESCGHPHTIVVTAAGLRAADLARSLRKFQSKDAMVAKLFAKHIKFKEATTRIGIGIGTPQRLIDLLDNGALSSKNLERIVIDASHINQKKRGIFDMKETEIPLTQLLLRKELKSRYSSVEGRISLLFF
ncbi:MAG: hypothetical protein Q9157_006581 [Trypethelium eluteriae]